MTRTSPGHSGSITGPPSAAAQTSGEGVRVSETILVVEDEEPVRIMLGRLLRSQGYSVVLAANASEARTVLSRLRPEMVVTDIIMPGENGIELRRVIASDWPEIPVLLISGFSDDGPAEFAARMANTAFLPKPFAAEHFLAVVAQMLDARTNGAAPHAPKPTPPGQGPAR